MSSRPFSSRCRTERVELEGDRAAVRRADRLLLEVDRQLASPPSSSRTSSAGSAIVSSPICAALLAKMSPNDGATTTSKP